MSDEISRLRNQLRRGLALLSFDGPNLELTDSEFRQCLLEVLVEESDDEIASFACSQASRFPQALGQDDHVIVEGNVVGPSFVYRSINVTARPRGVLLTDGVGGWV